jgi:hypothetical protein
LTAGFAADFAVSAAEGDALAAASKTATTMTNPAIWRNQPTLRVTLWCEDRDVLVEACENGPQESLKCQKTSRPRAWPFPVDDEHCRFFDFPAITLPQRTTEYTPQTHRMKEFNMK